MTYESDESMQGSIISDCSRYRLQSIYNEVKAMIDEGLSLKQIQEKGLSAQWKSWSGFIPEDKWISLVHDSIKAESKDS